MTMLGATPRQLTPDLIGTVEAYFGAKVVDWLKPHTGLTQEQRFVARLEDGSIDRLVAAERTIDLSGDVLVHNDVRSDNVCFRNERVILVDWSDARRGSPRYDLANFLSGCALAPVARSARAGVRQGRWTDGSGPLGLLVGRAREGAHLLRSAPIDRLPEQQRRRATQFVE